MSAARCIVDLLTDPDGLIVNQSNAFLMFVAKLKSRAIQYKIWLNSGGQNRKIYICFCKVPPSGDQRSFDSGRLPDKDVCVEAVTDDQYSVRFNFGRSSAGKFEDVGERFSKELRRDVSPGGELVREVSRFQ